MNTRRRLVASLREWALLAFVLVTFVLTPPSAIGQQITTLIAYTNVWKYDHSGAELGTAWRAQDFDDSAWPSGSGVLGNEDPAGIARYMAQVPSGFGTHVPVSQVTTTFYFRTTFTFDGVTNSTQLYATNLVDDGCAIWLNGQLAGSLRLPTNGSFNATTFASGGPPTEGAPEVLILRGDLLNGLNQLAVEVHQSTPTSPDVAFAMHLQAVTTIPLVITNQPQSYRVLVGESVVLTVGVTGGPVSYHWQKDGISLLSTSNSLSIANAQPANSGNYSVICSNSLTVVTSSVAVLTVIEDLSGPKVLAAIADNGFGPLTVNVRFSEPLTSSTARNLSNYIVTRQGNGATIKVTNSLYSSTLGILLQLEENNPDWIPYGNYFLTINNVADVRNNPIAPNTRVPIEWLHVTNLITSSAIWDFHDIAVFDPGVYEEGWYEKDYVPGLWWGQGRAGFQGGPALQFPCPYIAQPQVAISYQPEPTLFRTSFQWPERWSTNGILRLRYGADEGMVLYLNGAEIYRDNAVGPAGTPVTADSRAFSARAQTFCITNISLNATNLVPGTNWIAAAVVQALVNQRSYFVFDMSGAKPLGPELPYEPDPVLQMIAATSDRVDLSWSGSGYSLETSTNLDLGPLSHPAGPWTEVPQMSNPYSWSLTNGPQHFFRLRK